MTHLDFTELPFVDLIGLTIDQMTDDEIRALDRHLQEERTVPAARRATIKRESNKLTGKASGKKPSYNVNDLL